MGKARRLRRAGLADRLIPANGPVGKVGVVLGGVFALDGERRPDTGIDRGAIVGVESRRS